jgi:low temperature requirement protein LtrA
MEFHVLRSEGGRVGFAELFFDLVFVFAITQISHSLLHHYTMLGAYETAFLFLTVWWIWIYSTWVLNRMNPEETLVRGLLFVLMLLGLFLSMALPEAFGERGLIFALCVVAMQAGRTFFVWVLANDAVLKSTYLKILIWFLISALFWVAGGLVETGPRLVLWALALGIEYLGPVMGYALPGMPRDVTTNWTVRGDHMAERCGLFVIICLGETLLISGATFAELPWEATGLVAFVAVVATTIGMWWVYFAIGHKRGAHQIEHSDDPGRLARIAFTYAHIPIVAGIVLSAVGAERAIAHPTAAGGLAESVSIIGSLVIFLAGTGWFKQISGRFYPLSHLVGMAACVGAMLIGPMLPLLGLTALGAAILAVVALWEAWSLSRVG